MVEREIGRAGGEKQRAGRQREWDRRYGADAWAVGYVIGGEFVRQEDALQSVYYRSYEAHFRDHPEDLRERGARQGVAKPARGGDDRRRPPDPGRHPVPPGARLELQGTEVVDIGTWEGERSHPISVRLGPLHIPCVLDPKLTLEQWRQTKKCLAVWSEG